jgi:LPXTG-motif cell wall-anchored protein
MRRNWSRRLGVCAAALAAFLAGLSAFSATAVALDQRTVHGSATAPNACTNTFLPPGALFPSSTIGVTVSSDAGPQPLHDLDPVTLSNTTVEVIVPAGFLQPGVDAGIYGDGQTYAVAVAPVIAGSDTVEATQEFEQTTTTTVHVVDGLVLPLTATVQLPDTIWHPAISGRDIFFSEKSVRVVIEIDLLSAFGPVTLTSECAALREVVFIALGAPLCLATQADPCTIPTTTSPPESTVVNQSTTTPGGTTLPRTGSSSGYAVFVALSCIAGGALLLIRRRRNLLG